MKDQITFILSTNKRNYLFALPFMFFAAKYNKNSTFDLHIYKGCDTSYLQSGIDFIKMCFSCNVHVIDGIEPTAPPQLYRFLVDPVSQTQYAYCCDIDIMICEDILPFHIKKLQNGKYCYDNEIRQYSDPSKMSGLHFCTQSWYTQTKVARKKLLLENIQSNYGSTNCDERLLKKIAIDSNVNLQPLQFTSNGFWKNRPTHGQHISLSRRPFSPACSMEDVLDPLYKEPFIETIQSTQFKTLMKLGSKETRQTFNIYLEYVGLKDRF